MEFKFMDSQKVASIEYLLVLLEKVETTPFSVDSVVYVAKCLGVPLKYYDDFLFSPLSPTSPKVHDDVLTLLASRLIESEPSSLKYVLTQEGKRIVSEITKKMSLNDQEKLNKVSEIFKKLENDEEKEEFGLFLYVKNNNIKKIKNFVSKNKLKTYERLLQEHV